MHGSDRPASGTGILEDRITQPRTPAATFQHHPCLMGTAHCWSLQISPCGGATVLQNRACRCYPLRTGHLQLKPSSVRTATPGRGWVRVRVFLPGGILQTKMRARVYGSVSCETLKLFFCFQFCIFCLRKGIFFNLHLLTNIFTFFFSQIHFCLFTFH